MNAALRSSLLLLLSAAGGVLRADEPEEQAVKAVEKLAGYVTRDDKQKGNPVVAVNLSDTRVTDKELKELAALKQLKKLELRRTKVTDAGLKVLAPLDRIQ